MDCGFDSLRFCKVALGLGLLSLALTAEAISQPTVSTPLPNPILSANRYDYGSAVALTPDGTIAVVAANSAGYGLQTPPAVYLFQYANGAWGSTPSLTICDPADVANHTCLTDTLPGDLFASAVAVSSINSGSYFVIVGSPGGGEVGVEAVTYGVVYVYQCTVTPAACGTGAPIATLADPVASAADNFGSAIAISPDGNTILVGAWATTEPGGAAVSGNQANEGIAYVYNHTGGNTWALAASLLDPAPTCHPFATVVCDEFGYAVALAGTGSNVTALIGAPGAAESNTGSLQPGQGQAFIFGNSSGSWLLASTFTDPNTVACSDVVSEKCDEFGTAVALSADGTKALIGAPNAVPPIPVMTVQGEVGVANLYMQSSGSWQGVSAPAATVSNPQVPSAFNTPPPFNSIYTGVGGFGTSLALSTDGTTLLVGTPEALGGQIPTDYGGTGEMDVYTCSYSAASASCPLNGGRILLDPPTLQPPYPGPMDFFGAAVAMAGDASVFLAGAPDTQSSANGGTTNNGAAFVYGTPGGTAQVTLTLALSSVPNSVTPGGTFTYDIVVTNTSALSAGSLTLTDTLPVNVTYVSSSAAGGTCSLLSGTVTCTLPALAAGATWAPSITVTAGAATAAPSSISDSATVTAGSASATNSVSTAIIASPTANSASFSTGENTAYTGMLTGSGPSGSAGGPALTFAIVQQPAHGTVVITNSATGAFTYTPNSGYSGADSFTFDVSDGSTTSNAATVSITVSAAQVTLSYTGPNAASVMPGQQLTYTATVSGSGAVPADNLVMNVSVPAGLTLVSYSITSGACTGGTSVNCTLATLSSGSWVLTVIISVDSADTSGMVLASTAGLTLSNGTSTPASVNASVTVAAGATGGGGASGGGGGSLGWLELLALGGLSWFGSRRKYS